MATSSAEEADACVFVLRQADGGSARLLCLSGFSKLIQQEQSLAQELIIAKLSG